MNMKVTIFTIANIRPDFIEIQYDSIKKFLVDVDFEYIIFNNAFNNPKRYQIIEDICQKLRIRSISVNHHRDYTNDPSFIVSASLSNMWQNHLRHMKDFLFYVDSDMFLVKEISINNLMDGYDFGFVPNYRGKDFEVMYAWTGLMLFNMNTLPNPEELVWDTGSVLGHHVDVGGLNHYYLSKYKDRIHILNLEMYTLDKIILNTDGTKTITGSINGNAKISINLTCDSKLIELNTPDFHISETRFFPYQEARKNFHELIAENYIKFEEYLNNKNIKFPDPPYIDLIKTDRSNFEDCFIFHYKSGSNWLGFATEKYNQKKTEMLCELMSSLGVKSDFTFLKQHKTFFLEEDNHHMFTSKIEILKRKVVNVFKSVAKQVFRNGRRGNPPIN